MAKRATQGRIKLTQSERDTTDTPKTQEWDSGQKEGYDIPEGFRFAEEVPSSQTDNLVAEDAPKSRVDGQKISSPGLDLSPDSLQLANLCLGISNSFVVVMFGQECALYDGEKKLLYPSLSRVISRMPAHSAAKAAVFVDPLVLLFGIAVWANRIISIKTKQRTEANAITAREFAAASGVNWDTTPGQQPRNPEPNRPTGNGTEPVVPEARPDTTNANGTVGKVPDAIIQSGNNDIIGDGGN